jgi:hypothetical protein
MNERRVTLLELSAIEKALKDLQISYEQYFAGVEKREPIKQRDVLSRKLRSFANRHIVQTDLRFRYQNLATRFHTYANYWDRILRLMDEGRFVRGGSALPKAPVGDASPREQSEDEVDQIIRQLRQAGSQAFGGDQQAERDNVQRFLQQQREKIRATFGEKQVEFRVVVEDGKARIKVRAKK